jgi:hypothetical protein
MGSERTASEVRAALTKARRSIREAIETLESEVGPGYTLEVQVASEPYFTVDGIGVRWLVGCAATIKEGTY